VNREFSLFLLCGGIAALVNWLSRFLFSTFLGLGWAVAAAYLVGMTTAFILMKLFVFGDSRRGAREEYVRFALVNVVALAQVWLVTLGLADYLFPAMGFSWNAEAIAHAAGVLSPVIASYAGHRYFTFAPRNEAAPMATIPAPDLPLVVDLDGTLLRTDMLLENFAAALFRKPGATLAAVTANLWDRGRLKCVLARLASIDCATLPYHQPLLDYLSAQKSAGRNLHLVSASDETVVRRIGDHLAIFSSLHGSMPGRNLKGRRKVEHLLALFPDGFAYAGDSRADLHVWRRASSLVLTGRSRGVLDAARALGRPIEGEFPDRDGGWRMWRKGLRFHHWSKNALIFVAFLLSPRRLDLHAALVCLAGFILVGIAASATYLCNDLADLVSDRQHRSKRTRPLASGDMPIIQALVAVVGMLLFALTAATVLNPAFGLALAVYVITTLSYSFWFKRVALLDITVLASLYTLRIIMGTILAGVVFSPWLLTFAAIFFLSLSLAKRHAELVLPGRDPAMLIPGRGYRPADAPLTLALGVSTGIGSVLIIVDYLIAEAFPSGLYSFPVLLWTAPVALTLWIFRIWLLAHHGELHDDPVFFALRDRPSLALAAIMIVAFVLAAVL
jgi:4-hydroxybenzoate polyprenyltransferase/putative flippase GtrA